MPVPFHTWVKGRNQGAIEAGDGGVTDIQGREGSFLCQALSHTCRIPQDPQTGLPTGKRRHEALKITAAFDKGYPRMCQMLCTGEQCEEVVCKFYRISPKGMEEHYTTIKLVDAICVDIHAWVPQALDKNYEYFRHMVDYSFTYRKIVWTWEVDGIEAEDSWVTPK
jgi:type VI secretion system secreted protein Hcp